MKIESCISNTKFGLKICSCAQFTLGLALNFDLNLKNSHGFVWQPQKLHIRETRYPDKKFATSGALLEHSLSKLGRASHLFSVLIIMLAYNIYFVYEI